MVFLVGDLLDCDARDAYAVIQRAHLAGHVDETVCGDLEDVRVELGLQAARTRRHAPNELSLMGARLRDAFGMPDAEAHLPPVASAAPNRAPAKLGRNEPCPCGSWRKYKKYCMG